VKGALPDPVVEIEHPEERLIVLIAVDKSRIFGVGVQFEAAGAEDQRLLPG
jgi:hypothetical protein